MIGGGLINRTYVGGLKDGGNFNPHTDGLRTP